MSTRTQLTAPAPAHDVSSRRLARGLGRKGLETRRRLMAAALELLHTVSAVSLTAMAIARRAGTSPGTFYAYFDDVGDVVLALASEASEDLTDMLSALADWRQRGDGGVGARAFVDAYRGYWERHRAILVLRNMEADRGDRRFLSIRSRAGLTVIRELGHIIRAGHRDGSIDEEQAMARATVIFAAIERLCATALLYPSEDRGTSDNALAEAQIAILASLVHN